MLTRHVVVAVVVAAVGGDDDDEAVIVAAVEWLPLTDYVVMIVANFAPNSAIHLMEKTHYVKLETVAETVVAFESRSFGLSLFEKKEDKKNGQKKIMKSHLTKELKIRKERY